MTAHAVAPVTAAVAVVPVTATTPAGTASVIKRRITVSRQAGASGPIILRTGLMGNSFSLRGIPFPDAPRLIFTFIDFRALSRLKSGSLLQRHKHEHHAFAFLERAHCFAAAGP